MKKSFLSLILVIALIATVFAGCGNKEEASTDAPSSEASEQVAGEQAEEPSETEASDGAVKEGKYALVMSHMSNAFTTTFAASAKEEAEKLGIELVVFDGEKDAATQINQIETAVNQGYVGIMVEPVSVDGIKPAVEYAKEAGIPVVTVIQQITASDLVNSHVGGDDKAAGVLQMEQTIAQVGENAKIAIIWGPMGSDAQLIRKEGYDEVLAKYPNVEIVFDQTANWVTDEALSLTENWLQSGKQIDAIVSQNDSMAIGAVKAAEDAGKDIMISGIDATPDGIDAISAGRMTGTVSQDTPEMGRLSTRTLVDAVAGKDVPELVSTVPVWVNADNVADYK